MSNLVEQRPILLNAVGERSAVHVTHLVRDMHESNGVSTGMFLKQGVDLLNGVVATTGVSHTAIANIETALRNASARRLSWADSISMGSFRPSVTVTDNNKAAKEAVDQKKRKYGEVGTTIHMISFEGDERGEVDTASIKDSLSYLKDQVGGLHIAVLPVPNDVLGRRYFLKGVDQLAPDQFGMPVVITNSSRDSFTGVAGLVTYPYTMPHLNPYSSNQLITEVTGESNLIGISFGEYDAHIFRRKFGLGEYMSLNQLEDTTSRAISECLRAEAIGPVVKRGSERLSVIVISIPLNPKHPSWTDQEFFTDVRLGAQSELDRKKVTIPEGLVTVFGHTHIRQERSGFNMAIMTATRLFPAELSLDREKFLKGGDENTLLGSTNFNLSR